MAAAHHPSGETTPVASRDQLPAWWLQLTADDFNALQPLLTTVEVVGEQATTYRLSVEWLRYLVMRLRSWYEQQPTAGLADAIDRQLTLPGSAWHLEADVIPFMLLLSRVSPMHQVLIGPDIRARLVDLAFRMARHATKGRVGSPIIPDAEL